MRKALIALADGFEETEAVTIIDLLRRADIEVTVAGLREGIIEGSHQIRIEPDAYLKELEESNFDMLILPGGQPGSTNLKQDSTLLQWIRQRFERGDKLAAICAAPTVFHAAGITKHLSLTSFPAEKQVFTDSQYKEEAVVKDRNVITSRGVGTAIDFSLELIAELEGPEKASEIGERILHTYKG